MIHELTSSRHDYVNLKYYKKLFDNRNLLAIRISNYSLLKSMY